MSNVAPCVKLAVQRLSSFNQWRCFIPILFFQYWKTRHWDCMLCLVCLALCRFHLCGTKRILKGLHVWSPDTLVFAHAVSCGLTLVSPVWYQQEAEGTARVCCDLLTEPNCNLHHDHYTAEGCIFSLDYTAHFSPKLVSWVWIKYSTFVLMYEDVTCMGSSLVRSNQQGRSAPDTESPNTQNWVAQFSNQPEGTLALPTFTNHACATCSKCVVQKYFSIMLCLRTGTCQHITLQGSPCEHCFSSGPNSRFQTVLVQVMTADSKHCFSSGQESRFQTLL